MKVTVLKAHSYDGVNYRVGDVYECANKYFRALNAIGRVGKYVAPPEPKPKPKRQYTRRTPTPRTTAPTVDPDPIHPPSPRTYQRRDLEAED